MSIFSIFSSTPKFDATKTYGDQNSVDAFGKGFKEKDAKAPFGSNYQKGVDYAFPIASNSIKPVTPYDTQKEIDTKIAGVGNVQPRGTPIPVKQEKELSIPIDTGVFVPDASNPYSDAIAGIENQLAENNKTQTELLNSQLKSEYDQEIAAAQKTGEAQQARAYAIQSSTGGLGTVVGNSEISSIEASTQANRLKLFNTYSASKAKLASDAFTKSTSIAEGKIKRLENSAQDAQTKNEKIRDVSKKSIEKYVEEIAKLPQDSIDKMATNIKSNIAQLAQGRLSESEIQSIVNQAVVAQKAKAQERYDKFIEVKLPSYAKTIGSAITNPVEAEAFTLKLQQIAQTEGAQEADRYFADLITNVLSKRTQIKDVRVEQRLANSKSKGSSATFGGTSLTPKK